jgi:hypothetical protein
MKLANENIENHQLGVKNTTAFKVATNAKMMKLLSDSLYSDKILAPVRELSCNALDSHISVGKINDPFYVHLPSYDNPQFIIRDYGTGLTQEEMENLYTTYGESNKNDTNELIGCMGLGSKSPFAYTDSFTATSYKDGVKYVYIAGRDKTGIPNLNRMAVVDTDEPNGLEVAFACKRDDFHLFINAAKKVYKVFPTIPKIDSTVGKVDIEKKEVVLQGSGWRLYKHSTDKSVAVMGYVEYPIEPKFFSKYFKEGDTWYSHYHNNDNVEVNLLNLGLEIHFPIGEIDMDISRERLQYNDITINAIKNKLKVISDEIRVLVTEYFKNCKTLWEARCLYEELCVQKLRNFKDITKSIGLTWNGKDITKSVSFRNDSGLDVVPVDHGKAMTRRRYEVYVTKNKNTKFYVNDLPRGSYAAAKRDSADCYVYLFTFKGTDKEQALQKQLVIDTIGIDASQLVYVSTLPKVTPVKGATNRKTKQFTFIPKDDNNRYRKTQGDWWKEETLDLSNGGVYVELDGFNVKQEPDGNMIQGGSINDLYTSAKALGFKLDTIYGLRPSHVEKIKNNPKWVNLFTLLRKEVEDYANKNDYVLLLEEFTSIEKISGHIDFYHSVSHYVSPTTILGQFIANIKRVDKIQKSASAKISGLTSLANMLKYILPKQTGYDFEKAEKIVYSTYPMIEWVMCYHLTSSRASMLGDYIKLVNK